MCPDFWLLLGDDVVLMVCEHEHENPRMYKKLSPLAAKYCVIIYEPKHHFCLVVIFHVKSKIENLACYWI